jgi:hypothetical protein
MNKVSYRIIITVLAQVILVPGQALAQVASWSASSSGSGIGPSAVTSGTINTPGTVGATFAPQGGIGIQNYGISNASVTGVGGPNITAGIVGSTFAPQGSTGVQNYGTTNPGSLPNMGTVPLPNFSSSTNYGTAGNYGTAIPTVLPNTLIAPLPSSGSLNQSGLNSGGYNPAP